MLQYTAAAAAQQQLHNSNTDNGRQSTAFARTEVCKLLARLTHTHTHTRTHSHTHLRRSHAAYEQRGQYRFMPSLSGLQLPKHNPGMLQLDSTPDFGVVAKHANVGQIARQRSA